METYEIKDITASADWHAQEARILLNEIRPKDTYAQASDLERCARQELFYAARHYERINFYQHARLCKLCAAE